jgi:hypothetical protein
VTPGTLYKNRRHHPDRVFMVLRVQPVKRAGVKTARLYGLLLQLQNAEPVQETSFLVEEIAKDFPLVMWAP